MHACPHSTGVDYYLVPPSLKKKTSRKRVGMIADAKGKKVLKIHVYSFLCLCLWSYNYISQFNHHLA